MKRAMGTSEAPRTLRTTLPARAYTDAAWFTIEMDRLFAGMWLAAGRADQLDHPGAFIRREPRGVGVGARRHRRAQWPRRSDAHESVS